MKEILKKEYIKAQNIVERYEEQLKAKIKLAELNKQFTSADNKRLEKVKKLFPIGTKFISIYGAEDVVTKNEYGDTYFIGEFHNLFVCGKREARMVYDFDSKSWAKKIK